MLEVEKFRLHLCMISITKRCLLRCDRVAYCKEEAAKCSHFSCCGKHLDRGRRCFDELFEGAEAVVPNRSVKPWGIAQRRCFEGAGLQSNPAQLSHEILRGAVVLKGRGFQPRRLLTMEGPHPEPHPSRLYREGGVDEGFRLSSKSEPPTDHRASLCPNLLRTYGQDDGIKHGLAPALWGTEMGETPHLWRFHCMFLGPFRTAPVQTGFFSRRRTDL